MELASLDIFKQPDQVAWVGSGGKSTLIFSILNELYPRSILTTTTHLTVAQAENVHQHIVFDNPVKLSQSLAKVKDGITLISAGIDPLEPQKIAGFTPEDLKPISSFCLSNALPLFIEADGSRNKPIKSPADHEPQIPSFVTKVCVVVGLSGLGKPLSEEFIHRPQLFAKLTNKKLGEEISVEDLFRYLCSPEGGLKDIPKGAARILFLNQADLIVNKQFIYDLALHCKPFYDRVLVTSCDTKKQKVSILAHFGKIACVILAAGEAKRFNMPKQLAIWQGKTFIRTIVEKMQPIPMDQLIVITGAHADRVECELRGLKCKVVRNEDWRSGQASSVKKAIQNVNPETDAIIFLLVDQPQFNVDMVKNILQEHALKDADIITHEFNGMARHPVLFSKNTFPNMLELDGDAGGRQLFKQFLPLKIKIDDPFFALDVDTQEDLQELDNKRPSDPNFNPEN